VLEPFCQPPHIGLILSLTLTSSKSTVNGSLPITSLPEPVTAGKLILPEYGEGATLVLASVWLWGLGLKKRRAPWTARLLLVFALLVGFIGMTGCGANPKTLTPGTYEYVVKGTYQNGTSFLYASTNVNVTVPPGIPIQQP
jgi:anaerobic selenocysteine-containing dehydrogenase